MRRWLMISWVTLLTPLPAAALEWAVWGQAVGNSITGSFSGGRTVALSAYFLGGAGEPAGLSYTSSPAIPGTTNDTNPPFIRIVTGPDPLPSTIDANDPIAFLDLGGITVDATTTFGLADQRSGRQYRLELRDAASALLPLTGIQVTPYDLTYLGDGLIADYNSVLAGDLLLGDGAHSAGGFYLHTGLTTFSNLPAETREIRLISNIFQDAEGIQIYLAVAAPEPSAAGLGVASLLGLAGLAGMRRVRAGGPPGMRSAHLTDRPARCAAEAIGSPRRG